MKLMPWLDDHKKQDFKFQMMVISRLSRIECMLVQILGLKMASFWGDPKLTEAQREENFKGVDDKITASSNDLGLRIVKYIYGDQLAPEPPVGKRRRKKWSGWEI
jgi:hypothetical protein